MKWGFSKDFIVMCVFYITIEAFPVGFTNFQVAIAYLAILPSYRFKLFTFNSVSTFFSCLSKCSFSISDLPGTVNCALTIVMGVSGILSAYSERASKAMIVS